MTQQLYAIGIGQDEPQAQAIPYDHTLLGMPPEIRLLIIEFVCDIHDDEAQKPLAFDKDFVIGPAHPLLHVCQSLRREADPVYYNIRHFRFKHETHLRKVLLRAYHKIAELVDLHISATVGYENEWHSEHVDGPSANSPIPWPQAELELGIDLLPHLPQLRRVHVNVESVPLSIYYGSRSYGAESRGRKLCAALPKENPEPEWVEITGKASERGPLYFSRILELHEGKWKVMKRREWR